MAEYWDNFDIWMRSLNSMAVSIYLSRSIRTKSSYKLNNGQGGRLVVFLWVLWPQTVCKDRLDSFQKGEAKTSQLPPSGWLQYRSKILTPLSMRPCSTRYWFGWVCGRDLDTRAPLPSDYCADSKRHQNLKMGAPLSEIFCVSLSNFVYSLWLWPYAHSQRIM